MKSFVNYVIEARSGDIEIHRYKRGAWFKKAPRIKNGIIQLGKRRFVINPKYVRRWKKSFWRSPVGRHENLYVYLVEEIMDTMPFFHTFPQVKEMIENAKYTSESAALDAKSKLTSEFLHPNLNWGMLFLAFLGGLGVGAIILSAVQAAGG